MNIVDIILLVMHNEKDMILRGEPLLQKKIYFLTRMLRVDFSFEYMYYGPHSKAIEAQLIAITDFAADGISRIEPQSEKMNILGELDGYHYKLGPGTNKVWNEITKKKPKFDLWNFALKLLNKQFLTDDYDKFCIATIIHCLARNHVYSNGKIPAPDVSKVVKEFNKLYSEEARVSDKEIITFFDELDLIVGPEILR